MQFKDIRHTGSIHCKLFRLNLDLEVLDNLSCFKSEFLILSVQLYTIILNQAQPYLFCLK